MPSELITEAARTTVASAGSVIITSRAVVRSSARHSMGSSLVTIPVGRLCSSTIGTQPM